jgi:hypothetical protein
MFGSGDIPQYGIPQGSIDRVDDESLISDTVAEAPAVGQAQPTIILPASLPAPVPLGNSWSEVQTADGRVYFFNSETRESQWSKPENIMSEEERAVLGTGWRELKIWDGRSYFYNDRTNCSVWHVPPEVALARGQYGPEMKECAEYDTLYKSEAKNRMDFFNLLQENGIDETFTFERAVEVIKDDTRFSALPTSQAKQLFFASYVSNSIKMRTQEARDSKRALLIQAVTEWRNWKDMSESVTFSQMESVFNDRAWFKALETTDIRKIFQVFSLEFIEIEKLKKRKLQDALMQEMKNDILNKLDKFDLGSSSAVEVIFQTYSSMKPQPQFWSYLSDSQKLVVIKSCISQRIRDMRMAVANRLPLSREKRAVRQERDRMKKLISEFVRTKAETKVVRRGHGLVLPEWNTELEAYLASQAISLPVAQELFSEFVEDMKLGKDPLEGII